MADDETVRRRIGLLADSRWRELLTANTPVGRRARTMGTCAAIRETLQLATYARHAEEESLPQTRGEKMFADVAAEAQEITRHDAALDSNRQLKEAVQAALTPSEGIPKDHWISHLASLLARVEGEYVELAEASLLRPFHGPQPSLVAFEVALEQLAAHGRALGWSDEGLTHTWQEIAKQHSDPSEQIKQLCSSLREDTRAHTCAVQVDLDTASSELFNLPERKINVRNESERACVEIGVMAHDPWAAARTALLRVSALIGAPNIFQDRPNAVWSTSIRVSRGANVVDVDVADRILRDHHNPRRDQIKRIVDVAARSHDQGTDTLYDAVRNHQRALTIEDPESAFVLLWSALERLCANPVRPEPILAVTATLISGAIAFSKVRREVANLSDDLTAYLKATKATGIKWHEVDASVIRPERNVVLHDDILNALIGTKEQARTFCAPFYEDVRLTQWFFRLRQQLASQSDSADKSLSKRLPKMIEDSRRRTRWQVLRLYRARNFLAHGASHPQWLMDFARHAHYLLTNALAICLNYASSSGRSAKDILQERCGWLDAYLSLVRLGEPRAISTSGMLKPSHLFSPRL